MKLFLASRNFGSFVEILQDMVSDSRKTLVITNARDFLSDEERKRSVKEKLDLFREHGFEVEELDLRNYFASLPERLEEYIMKYNPGLIYSIGGDMFMLATALNVSGMDEIIRRRVKSDKSVYGGSSAGSIIASNDIEIYERDELEVETIPSYYGVEAVTSGLGLIDNYIIPHVGVEKFAERTKFYEAQLQKIHAEYITLGENDVYILDNGNKIIKRS